MFKVRKWISKFLLLSICTLVLLPNTYPVLANAPECRGSNINYVFSKPMPLPEGLSSVDVTFTGVAPGYYRLRVERFGGSTYYPDKSVGASKFEEPSRPLTITITDAKTLTYGSALANGSYTATLEQYDQNGNFKGEYCGYITYKVGYNFDDCQLSYWPSGPRENERIWVSVIYAPAGTYDVVLITDRSPINGVGQTYRQTSIIVEPNGTGQVTTGLPPTNKPLQGDIALFKTDYEFCTKSITITAAEGKDPRPGPPPAPALPPGAPNPPGIPVLSGGKLCDDDKGIQTAIGCIHTNPAELVKDLMTFIIGIGGGMAFLLMLLGAYQMLSSGGNPETLNAGRERLTNAVIGLLFVIFAVLLMQIVGMDILKIPGFGR